MIFHTIPQPTAAAASSLWANARRLSAALCSGATTTGTLRTSLLQARVARDEASQLVAALEHQLFEETEHA